MGKGEKNVKLLDKKKIAYQVSLKISFQVIAPYGPK